MLHLKKILILTYEIISTINMHDTLKPLGIWFMPFANSVRDTIHTINGVLKWGFFLSKAHIVIISIKQSLGVEIGCMTENGSMWLILTLSYTQYVH